MAGKVAFTEDAAKRVAAATLAYERGNRDMPPIRWRQGGDDGENVRLGKINAPWDKNNEATVTQLNGDGSDIDGNPTFNAKNFFATIPVEDGTEKKVACGRVGDTWILIAAEC